MTPFGGQMEQRRIEFYADLVDVVDRKLTEAGVPAETARAVANLLADDLSDHWGGQYITFPQDYHRKIASRDLAIYEEFNGWNYGALARKYRMTDRGMRRLIQRARVMFTSRTQGSLFDPPAPD